ncbi:MAG: hypothetical protein R3F61_22950 [Myxococcota bacterium]
MRRSRRNIPDPSATEPPQQFKSEESTRLRERVFEVVAAESRMEPDEPSEPLITAPPDKVVKRLEEVAEPAPEPQGSALRVWLLGGLAFLFAFALVSGLGTCGLGLFAGLLASL